MALQNIEKLATMTDPLKQFMFSMVITEMKGGKINAENFELQCQSYTFPGTEMSVTNVSLGGWTRQDAALQNRAADWNVTVVETWDATIYDEFESWMNIAHDVEAGTISSATEYKTSARVSIVNGQMAPVKTRVLKQLFPKNVGASTYAPTGPDAVTIPVTFHYDYWK